MSRAAACSLAVVLLATGGVSLLSAQSPLIRGRVLRADEPVALANVELTLAPSGTTTRSDPLGYFVFRSGRSVDAAVSARLAGFTPATVALRADPGVAVEIRLVPIAARLDPIVTSVTRDARSLHDVGGAVTVADSSAIARGRTVGIHEVLRTMPGVQVNSRTGTEDLDVGIRGSAARATTPVSGIMVLLDGVPLTEPDGRGRLDLIELTAARQVEVVRGPASALYAGSSGGVINVVSRTGRDSPGTDVRAQAGSFGFRKYDGRAGGPFASDRGSAFAAASYTATDGFRAHSDARMWRAHVSTDYLVAPGTRLAFQASGSRLESHLPGALSQSEFDSDAMAAAPFAAPFAFGRDDNRYRAGVIGEKDLHGAAVSSYAFYSGRTFVLTVPGVVLDLDFHRVQGGGRLRAVGVGRLPLDVTVGVDYDGIGGPVTYRANDGGVGAAVLDAGRDAVTNVGPYGQLDWNPSRTFNARLGLRYDHVTYWFDGSTPEGVPHQERTLSRASPRLSATWRPDGATSVYASVGQGFEVPAFGEISDSPGAPLNSVSPKSLWNYEVGARRIAANRLLVEADVFVARVRNEFVPITRGGLEFLENASRSRNAGAELAMTVLATPWLDVATGYAFIDMRLHEYTTSAVTSSGTSEPVSYSGKRMPGVPAHRLTGEVHLKPLGRTSLGVQLEWQSRVFVETSNALEGTWYVQSAPGGSVQQVPFRAVPAGALVHLNGSIPLGAAILFVGAENLLDRTYVGHVVTNDAGGRFYETGQPRLLTVGLSVAAGGRTACCGKR